MEAALTKESRLNIRCDSHARDLLARAASYAHVSVSEFVLSHALASAEKLVQEYESITLQSADFAAFLNALDTPAAPSVALTNAFRLHAEQVTD